MRLIMVSRGPTCSPRLLRSSGVIADLSAAEDEAIGYSPPTPTPYHVWAARKKAKYADGPGDQGVKVSRMQPDSMIAATEREPHLRPVTSPSTPQISMPVSRSHVWHEEGPGL